ncbi:hypothetical protein QUB08_11285 [Microcoleus sp. BR0-C5]|uniref:hypothetical protein n=1 Tax=Microcoleus sp. BR0-C5 TaxID=2818713 RepID=UPI002FD531FD
MQLWHPLHLIPSGLTDWLVLGLLVALTLGLAPKTNHPSLTTKQAPRGILSFEFAGNEKTASAMIVSWQEKGAYDDALSSLYWDNFFLLAYSTAIALGCMMAADSLHAPGTLEYNLAILLAWAQWLAALLDLTENFALEKMLRGAVKSPWPQIAWWCAIPKFIIIVAGIGYVVIQSLSGSLLS